MEKVYLVDEGNYDIERVGTLEELRELLKDYEGYAIMDEDELQEALEDFYGNVWDYDMATFDKINYINDYGHDEFIIFDNDDEGLNLLVGHLQASEIIQKVIYGDYDSYGDYVRLDGYENLESLSKEDLINELDYYKDSFVEDKIEDHIWVLFSFPNY